MCLLQSNASYHTFTMLSIVRSEDGIPGSATNFCNRTNLPITWLEDTLYSEIYI